MELRIVEVQPVNDIHEHARFSQAHSCSLNYFRLEIGALLLKFMRSCYAARPLLLLLFMTLVPFFGQE